MMENAEILPGLKNVYYYITFECNLRCKHCYVGENLASHKHADYHDISKNLAQCYANGARKIVFLGGESTLHPRYYDILDMAADVGFERITVDTNGIAQYPVPQRSWIHDRLAVRISFEGAETATHDHIRGKNTFNRALTTLRKVVSQRIRTEVTLTINALNYWQIAQAVAFFEREQIAEMNFHFISLMGNGKQHPELGLSAEQILAAQACLDSLKTVHDLSLRYPKLLVKREFHAENRWQHTYRCRIYQPDVLLVFPEGQMFRCPLQISAELRPQWSVPVATLTDQCPLAWRLLPEGIPEGHKMTCISWKEN
jgi:MoaA/NifB/PqqE/SkfB family radical SAM enzyme